MTNEINLPVAEDLHRCFELHLLASPPRDSAERFQDGSGIFEHLGAFCRRQPQLLDQQPQIDTVLLRRRNPAARRGIPQPAFRTREFLRSQRSKLSHTPILTPRG